MAGDNGSVQAGHLCMHRVQALSSRSCLWKLHLGRTENVNICGFKTEMYEQIFGYTLAIFWQSCWHPFLGRGFYFEHMSAVPAFPVSFSSSSKCAAVCRYLSRPHINQRWKKTTKQEPNKVSPRKPKPFVPVRNIKAVWLFQRSIGSPVPNNHSKWNPPTPLWRWRRAYWGANSHTKCSTTFVNIAMAISVLAGGGLKMFAPNPELGGVFVIFGRFLGVGP